LDNLIIFHEQFITKDNDHLRFLSAQQNEEINSNKLVRIDVMHTSVDNPLFTSSKYNGLENQVRIHFSKLIVTLQLEAILSIMRFQDNFMEKWPRDIFEEQVKKKQQLEENKIIHKIVKKSGENFFLSIFKINSRCFRYV
jgi:hypothetical protein